MRKLFAKEIFSLMEQDENIYVLTGDLGFGVWDEVKSAFPSRFINCGASEQVMMDVAVGLAYSGKTPIVYSITPFLLYRPFETIRTYINHEELNVKMIGSGRDKDYAHDGFSHDASDVFSIMSRLRNIRAFYPQNEEELSKKIGDIILKKFPAFVSLTR